MSTHITEYSSGLKQVMFHTKDKWVEYEICYAGGYDGNLQIILDTFDGPSLAERIEVTVPNRFMGCVKYLMQEKDQISVLFVPKELLHSSNLVTIVEPLY